MAFKIKRFIPEASPLTIPDPVKGKYKRRKNTTDRKVVRKLARQAANASKKGKDSLIQTFNASDKQEGSSAPTTTVQTDKPPKKVKKREIKKALQNANVARGDKVYVSDGKVEIITKKPLTKDQKIAALNKKKVDELARRGKFKEDRLAKVTAKKEALKAKQYATRNKRAAYNKKKK